jgi:hypothetical protein
MSAYVGLDSLGDLTGAAEPDRADSAAYLEFMEQVFTQRSFTQNTEEVGLPRHPPLSPSAHDTGAPVPQSSQPDFASEAEFNEAFFQTAGDLGLLHPLSHETGAPVDPDPAFTPAAAGKPEQPQTASRSPLRPEWQASLQQQFAAYTGSPAPEHRSSLPPAFGAWASGGDGYDPAGPFGASSASPIDDTTDIFLASMQAAVAEQHGTASGVHGYDPAGPFGASSASPIFHPAASATRDDPKIAGQDVGGEGDTTEKIRSLLEQKHSQGDVVSKLRAEGHFVRPEQVTAVRHALAREYHATKLAHYMSARPEPDPEQAHLAATRDTVEEFNVTDTSVKLWLKDRPGETARTRVDGVVAVTRR